MFINIKNYLCAKIHLRGSISMCKRQLRENGIPTAAYRLLAANVKVNNRDGKYVLCSFY